jgi:hypothetical protein
LNRGKKIFLALSAVFLLALLIVSYDISRRTTRPGARGLLRESIVPSGDSLKTDSTGLKTTKP